jgi:hypothetical protein
MTECLSAWGWFSVVAVPTLACLGLMTLNHIDGTPVSYYKFKVMAANSLLLTSAICAAEKSMYGFTAQVLVKLFLVQMLVWAAASTMLHSVLE